MAENNVTVELELITKAFEVALREASKSVEGFGKDFEKAEGSASKSMDTIGKAGKSAGKDVSDGAKEASGAWDTFKAVLGAEAVVGAFNFVAGAAKSLFNTFVIDGVAGAREAEASLVKLKSTLAITGDEANGTLEDFQGFAAQMQANTKADGDAVLAQLSLAKQYGLTNEQAKLVVTTATDMAARGYDADASVKQLSESFSGQAGRLAKLNPALKGLTEEQLKAGAGALILAEQFSGSAAAAVNTFDGKLAQNANTFGDLQEEIGFLITQNPAFLDAIGQGTALIQTLTQYIADNSDVLKELVGTGLTLFIDGITTAVDTGLAFIGFLQDNAAVIEALGFGLGVAALAYGAYTLAVNASAIATGIATAAQVAFNVAMNLNPIGIVITGLGLLAAGIYYAAQNWDLITGKLAGFAATALQLVLPAINLIISNYSNLVRVFDEDLANSMDAVTVSLEEKIAELQAFQAEKEAEAAASKQLAREEDAARDAEAHANKLAGLTEANAAELAAAQAQNTAKKNARATALLTEAEQQKAADEAAKAQKKKADDEAKAADKEFQRALEEERKKARAEHEKNDAAYKESLRRKAEQEKELQIRRETSLTDAIKQQYGARQRFEEQTNQQKVANFRSTMGEIATLQNSSSRELFAVGKAAALTEATIRTYQAANVALASAPPPFGAALAAAVVTAGLLNVAKIASAKPPSAGSFASGGIVPGNSLSGDNLTANVNSREAIFNLDQQKRLFAIANGSANGSGGQDVVDRLDRLEQAILGQPIVVQIDGEAVATAVRTQVRGGFALGGS